MVVTNVTDKDVLYWQLRHPLVVWFLEMMNSTWDKNTPEYHVPSICIVVATLENTEHNKWCKNILGLYENEVLFLGLYNHKHVLYLI